MQFPIEALFFLLLLAVSVAIARSKDLFSAAMLLGVFSFLSASLFTFMDAVDVAITEASVGAGVSTVLILGGLLLTDTQERQQPTRLLPFVVVGLTGAALIYGTLDMPLYGDPMAPIHHHVANEYVSEEALRFGIPNVVTAVLASWRGYDTLGETSVVLTAATGVMALLGGVFRGRKQDPSKGTEGGEA
ncbi:MAG: DUF4040 domain-containing protein [Deltaproteobacteria bacterium]|nr:DUF4040 domain-containing protein [Deltaproteobacteria bacterium]